MSLEQNAQAIKEARASLCKLIILGVPLFVAACNGGTSSSSGASPTPTPSPSPTPTPSPTPVTAALSITLPYSTIHAGVQTPVMVVFSGPINPSTVESTSFYLQSSGGGRVSGTESISVDNMSATFTPAGPMAYRESYTVYATASITDASGNPITPLTINNTFTTQPESYSIFVSTESYDGNLGGIDGADAICSSDPQCIFPGGCSALLADNAGTRVAAPTPNNWVLQPYTAYQNESNQLIGITGITSTTIAPANSSVFGFNLANPINASSPNNAWTGMNGNWTTNNGGNCGSWTLSGNQYPALVGDPTSATNSSISNTGQHPSGYACSVQLPLYCVEQP